MATSGVTDRPVGGRFRLRQQEVSWRREDFGFVLYDRRTDTLYEGNHLGREILQRLDDGRPIEALGAELHARYMIPREQVAGDIVEFLQFLVFEDLVVRC